MNEQKVEQAKQFLNDYVLSNHQKIENWFSGGRQRALINANVSNWALVTRGVPQGSTLGPLLFIVHVNGTDIGVGE